MKSLAGRALVATSLVAFAAGCDPEPTPTSWAEPVAPASTHGNAGGGSAGGGDRLLFRAWDEWTPDTDATGDTSMVLEHTYAVMLLRTNGYAWVGTNPDAIDEIICDGPRTDAKGKDLCVPYTIVQGSITLGKETKTFAEGKDGSELTIGSDTWRVLPPATLTPAKYTLAGYYGAVERVAATVEGASVDLRAGGALVASRAARSYRILDWAVWSSCSGDCTVSGSYVVNAHSVTVKVGDVEKRLFLRVEDGVTQLGRQWYSVE